MGEGRLQSSRGVGKRKGDFMHIHRAGRSMLVLFFFVIISLAVGQSGVIYMTPDAFAWYKTLVKPDWTPPNVIFPFVWTFLYLLMGIAAWLVWREKKDRHQWALSAWFTQLLLNGLWTPVFFGYHQLQQSMIVIALYILSVLVTTVFFYKHHKLAGFLMTLVLVWVLFAGVLNYVIWQLN